MKSKINVGVIFGGRSVENEISVLTALQAINAIDTERYSVTPIYISKQGRWYTGKALTDSSNYRHMDSLLASCDEVYLRPTYGDNNLYKVNKPLISYFKQMFNISKDEIAATLDVILPALHGTNCEDGSFQGVIEMTGIPYAGCNVLSSANGMDKITMKMILKESGIPVIDYTWFCDKEWYDNQKVVAERVEATLGYPVIVKPADSGSSVGITAVHNREELIEAVDNAASYSKRIIVEHLVKQLKEINCSVLGNYYDCEASVCEAPIRSSEILSYADKYLGGARGSAKGGAKCGSKSAPQQSEGMRSTLREIPANLPDEVTALIRTMAVKTFKTLACDGVSRIDFMIDEANGKIYVNEINTIPGSLSFYLWEASGVSFPSLVQRLIDIAFQRKRDSATKVTSYKENIFNYTTGATGAKGAKGAKGTKL